MDLKKTISLCRKLGASQERIYTILTLIEIDAIDTPIFSGLEDHEKIRQLYHMLNVLEIESLNQKWPEGFPRYLLREIHLFFNPKVFTEVYKQIEDKGERYGFKKFNGLV